ncbi:MAG: hypothetical protein JKY09_03220, partial [Crocinitomicaceae bacterium]|nr:hypothetical protein [Crocinitomicaceae bacterium]
MKSEENLMERLQILTKLMKNCLLIICLLSLTNESFSQVRTSVNSGDWSNTATWDCGCVPSASEDAVIASGHNVSLTSNTTINNLTIDSGGLINDDGAGFMTIDGNITVNGTYTGTKRVNLTGGSGIIIDGTGIINNNDDFIINGDVTIAATANLTRLQERFRVKNGVTVTNNGSVIIEGGIQGNGTSATWITAANSSLKVGLDLLSTG